MSRGRVSQCSCSTPTGSMGASPDALCQSSPVHSCCQKVWMSRHPLHSHFQASFAPECCPGAVGREPSLQGRGQAGELSRGRSPVWAGHIALGGT